VRPEEQINICVFDEDTSTWIDINEGIISIDTSTGSDYFQGFWAKPETGYITIVSRNKDLDPYINELIRTNRRIKLNVGDANNGLPLFLGVITDFNIEYRQKDDPLITINGVDYFGYLNRLVITEEFLEENVPDETIAFADFVQLFSNDNVGFLEYQSRFMDPITPGILPYAPPNSPMIKPKVGDNVFELIAQAMATGMMDYSVFFGQYFNIHPYYKHDFGSQFNGDNPYQYSFNSEGYIDGSYPYKFISIDDGFQRTVNQVEISNTNLVTDVSENYGPFIDNASLTEWGPGKINVPTTFDATRTTTLEIDTSVSAQVEFYKDNTFELQSVPKMLVNSITVDVMKQFVPYGPSVAFLPTIGSGISIEHKINETTTITGTYVVIGLKHRIDRSDWYVEYILRENELPIYDERMPKVPQISIVPSLSGTTGTNFTASITNYTTEDYENIESVEWYVNDPGFDYQMPPSIQKQLEENYFWYDFETEQLVEGNPFENAPILNGNTVTWNYLPNGVLSGYPDFFTGPGVYNVMVFVKNNQGYFATSDFETIDVLGNQAFANFTYTKDAYETVTFYDASNSDTISWEWDFGDGTTFSGKNPPPKTYDAPDTYQVSLTVDNGEDTDTLTLPVTINLIDIPVKYVRLRFDGTVTSVGGVFNPDLIESWGRLLIVTTQSYASIGLNPFYIHARNLQSVRLYAEEEKFSKWPNALYAPSGWTPELINTTGDYYGQGLLNPMSQSYGSDALDLPKYRFQPIVSGSSKTYDFDLTFDFSSIIEEPAADYFQGVYGWDYKRYFPGGNLNTVEPMPRWGSGSFANSNQRYKVIDFAFIPIGNNVTNTATNVTLGELEYAFDKSKSYLPIEVSVSPDGNVFRTVGTLSWTAGSTSSRFTFTPLGAMPPNNTLPVQTP
jgi:PKD repeat protein